MQNQAKINEVFFNEETLLVCPNMKFIKFIVDREFEKSHHSPSTQDYIFYISKLLHILIDEMQWNEDVQEKLQKFIDDFECNFTVKEFLNVE